MFNFIKDKLSKIYSQMSSKLNGIFSKDSIDQNVLLELENLLISSDMGIKTVKKVIEELKSSFLKGEIKKGEDLKKSLEKILINLIKEKNINFQENKIFLLVGINGSGKTTFIGKLSHKLQKAGKKVLLVAGDTFRAAAVDQLEQWAKKSNVEIEKGEPNQDPASVIFDGCSRFKNENFDYLIIDTAGRLQTKINLMKELEKIKKVVSRQLPDYKICTLLTIDAMLGQNSFEQAKIFNESTNLDAIVLTKMDSTAKGGIVIAINQELNLPVSFVSFGEEIDKLKEFNAHEYVEQLLS